MTIPTMMNCSHQGEGWCLDCVAALAREKKELEDTFDLRWAADMRAIEQWRKAGGPERELQAPDHADLVCFLAKENQELRATNGGLCTLITALKDALTKLEAERKGVLADLRSQLEQAKSDAIAAMLLRLTPLTAEERMAVYDELHNEFCIHCGQKQCTGEHKDCPPDRMVGRLRKRILDLHQDLSCIQQMGHFPADTNPNLIGVPDRYAKLTQRMADFARESLKRDGSSQS